MSRFFLLRAPSKGNVYSKSKAIADALFLEANDPDGSKGSPLRTLSIRMPPMYGERDMQMIHGALIQLNKGQTHIQNWRQLESLRTFIYWKRCQGTYFGLQSFASWDPGSTSTKSGRGSLSC